MIDSVNGLVELNEKLRTFPFSLVGLCTRSTESMSFDSLSSTLDPVNAPCMNVSHLVVECLLSCY